MNKQQMSWTGDTALMEGEHSDEMVGEEHVSPENFDEFLPWATRQLGLPRDVHITRQIQDEYLGADRLQLRTKKTKTATEPSTNAGSGSLQSTGVASFEEAVNLTALYDGAGNLVQLRFERNKEIPRALLQLLALVARFHPALSCVSVRRGLDAGGVRALAALLARSAVRELVLDGCARGPGLHALLQPPSQLAHLSLARCGLTDAALAPLAAALALPHPASLTLVALNLCSNRITDVGVKYIAEMLRTNRKLTYLNLAGNDVSDEGASAIFDVLGEFPLRVEELLASRERKMVFLREKMTLNPDHPPAVSGASEKGANPKKTNQKIEKKEADLFSEVKIFNDPYSRANLVVRNGHAYCRGNNALSYLNLSYTGLSLCSAERLQAVLLSQRREGRRPRGLVTVLLEGNALPATSPLLSKISQLLDVGLMMYNTRISQSVKRRLSRRV